MRQCSDVSVWLAPVMLRPRCEDGTRWVKVGARVLRTHSAGTVEGNTLASLAETRNRGKGTSMESRLPKKF